MKIFDIDIDVLLEGATNENSEFVFVEERTTGSLINVIMIPLFFAVSALLFLSDGVARKLLIKKPAPFLFIIAMGFVMMASISTSEHTNVAIIRSGSQILFLSALAFLAYALHDQQRLLLTVGLAFLSALIIDIALYFTLGTGFTETGGFTGYQRSKNVTGHQYAIATMIFVSLAILRKNPLFLLVALVSAAIVLSTESKTAMGAIGIFVVFSLFYRIAIARVIIVILTVLGSVAISLNFAMGKNDPEIFTGRGEIWNFLAPYLWDKTWLGHGFSSFWDIGPQAINKIYGDAFIENINTGHNGYIDLILSLGVVGLALAIGFLLLAAVHLSQLDVRYLFIHYLFIAFLISNLTESFLFYYQNSMWTILVLLTFATYAHHRPARRRRTSSLKSSEFI